MKNLVRIASHWEAKLLTLALAVLVWAVIRKSIEATASPSNRFRFEAREPADRFEFSKKR
jgi:hypothetical protein